MLFSNAAPHARIALWCLRTSQVGLYVLPHEGGRSPARREQDGDCLAGPLLRLDAVEVEAVSADIDHAPRGRENGRAAEEREEQPHAGHPKPPRERLGNTTVVAPARNDSPPAYIELDVVPEGGEIR